MPAKKKSRSRLRPSPTAGRDERRRPTINDVARLANVSKKTVSRVINNSPLVRAATRARVAAIVSNLGFSPDPQARGLASRRSSLIGLICADPLPQSVVEIQQGILDAFGGLGFELIIRSCNRKDPNFLRDIRDFVEGHRLFGVVVAPPLSADAGLIGLLRELACPAAWITADAGRQTIDLAFAAATNLIAAKA